MRLILIYLSVACFILTACSSTVTVKIHPPIAERSSEKVLALFLDGTQNDRDKRTNISTLSEIVTHQNKDNLYVFYNEGVGTKFIGAGTGWGLDTDVAEAYTFLSEYYSPDSKLYIFGFSRGAYTSRILAGMIYAIGIYDLTSFDKDDRLKISKQLYHAYKIKDNDVESIRKNGAGIIDKWNGKFNSKKTSRLKVDYNPSIEVMGLWDTVEALGVIPTLEAMKRVLFGIEDPQNIVNPNERYIDQICNVKHVYHALSLDDNRANVFTPIIISSDNVALMCEKKDSSILKVEEVWFAGAHSDVGGGYSINENTKEGEDVDRDIFLSGLSLNWMISKIKESAPELLPKNAEVFENPLAFMHDAENGNFMYKRMPRYNILTKYKEKSRYNKLKMHSSVMIRLAQSENERKKLGYDSEWYKLDEFKECFDIDERGGYVYKDCSLIEVVE
ncbi:DUF2235 domain-containing protein [Desulfobulbus sp. US1]|nr:DUF2235 domain-containing protein [Desulfobulbus sp. US4]MCW5208937.1 DUF2235 domain-containing protein [Desulfobulbus sp. US1]